jgi:hypothetical protein
MEPVREGLFTKIGVIVAIIGVAIAWYYAPNRAVVTEVVSPVATPSPTPVGPVPVPSPSASPAETVAPRETVDESPSAPPHRDQPGLPLEFTLHDGDQKTFLGDQASVAAEFNQIGSEEVVTLKVGTTDAEPVPHAVLGAGARYPFRLAGNTYSVYVLSVDKNARTVEVRISRSSESP